jgi:NAD(P)-dependent dehydrogenase (short-subunit alcohol dehydrogenase family)
MPGPLFYPLDPVVGNVEVLDSDALSKVVSKKRALVVGGSSGIGLGTAKALAAAGADVVVLGSRARTGELACEQMKAAALDASCQEFQYYAGDLSTVKGCVSVASNLSGKFDYVVITVGIWPDKENPQTADGVDKVIALDVLARFIIVEEVMSKLTKGARVLSVCGSTSRSPPSPTVDVMKQLILGEKTRYLTPQMLATAGVTMDAWLQVASSRHPDMHFIGTFPGIVGTDLLVNSKTFPSCVKGVLAPLSKMVALTLEECGQNQLQILASPNAGKRPASYFNSVRLEGRSTNPVAYDKQFGEWVWSFLEEKLSKLR